MENEKTYLLLFPVILSAIREMKGSKNNENVLSNDVLRGWKDIHEKLDDTNPKKKLLHFGTYAFLEHTLSSSKNTTQKITVKPIGRYQFQ